MLFQPPAKSQPDVSSNTELVRIYHDPECPVSRAALAHLRERGFNPAIVDASKKRLSVDQLRKIVRALGTAPSSMIRRREFNRLGLTTSGEFEDLLQLMAAHPELIDRPIVFFEGKARICRPLEKLYDLVD